MSSLHCSSILCSTLNYECLDILDEFMIYVTAVSYICRLLVFINHGFLLKKIENITMGMKNSYMLL